MPASKLATSVYVAPKVNDLEWTSVRKSRDYQTAGDSGGSAINQAQYHIPGQAHREGGSLNKKQHESMQELKRE